MSVRSTEIIFRCVAHSKVRSVAMKSPIAQDFPVHSTLDIEGSAWDGPRQIKARKPLSPFSGDKILLPKLLAKSRK